MLCKHPWRVTLSGQGARHDEKPCKSIFRKTEGMIPQAAAVVGKYLARQGSFDPEDIPEEDDRAENFWDRALAEDRAKLEALDAAWSSFIKEWKVKAAKSPGFLHRWVKCLLTWDWNVKAFDFSMGYHTNPGDFPGFVKALNMGLPSNHPRFKGVVLATKAYSNLADHTEKVILDVFHYGKVVQLATQLSKLNSGDLSKTMKLDDAISALKVQARESIIMISQGVDRGEGIQKPPPILEVVWLTTCGSLRIR